MQNSALYHEVAGLPTMPYSRDFPRRSMQPISVAEDVSDDVVGKVKHIGCFNDTLNNKLFA